MTVVARRWAALLAATAIALAVALLGAGSAHATAALPFSDPNAQGFIAFCNQDNQPVTTGNVNTVPFVWKAISSALPPKSFLGAGQNTVLDIYQPREGVDPGDWSGDQLTGASYFKNSDYPTAQATYSDFSLAQIIKEYPPKWNGMYVLRMQFAKTSTNGDDTEPYPQATIQVKGDTWSVIQGGTLPCAQATSTSDETYLGLGKTPSPGTSSINPGASVSAPKSTATSKTDSSAASPGSAEPSSGSSGSLPAGATIIGPSNAADSHAAGAGGSSSVGLWVGIVVAVVVVLGAVGGWLFWRRGRGPASA